ncbi:MAG: hypothetical protein E6Q87_02195 [Cellvibrionales bacterium]|nr:MAG: hypothetical protein E6Q87_02195 [Cellvibrionales bacterium]
MKKLILAAAVAATFPLMANAAAPISAANAQYHADAGSITLNATGGCYGLQFKVTKTKVTTGALPSSIDLQFGSSDQVGGSYTWTDPLLDAANVPENVISGTILTRKGNTLTMSVLDNDQKLKAGTALLTYASQHEASFGPFFSALLSNAAVTEYSVKVALAKPKGVETATITEKSAVTSTNGGCSSTATITRVYKAPRV